MEINTHAWKVRFLVGLTMLIIALLGMAFTNAQTEGAWIYWHVGVPLYALLSLGLSLYLRHRELSAITATIRQEIFHWAGTLLAIYVISILIRLGFITRTQANLEILLLLALSTFLAGVYIEPTFLVVGILLGCLIAGVAFFTQYLYAILFLLTFIIVLMAFWLSRRKKTLNPSSE